MKRREFIKASGAVIGSSILKQGMASASHNSLDQLVTVHPFIENNPDAVFVMKTNVNAKTDSTAIRNEALSFANSVFTTTTDTTIGKPLDHNVVIKPNLTDRGSTWQQGYTIEGTMGVITDANFVEGVIDSLKGRGITSDKFYIREVNGKENLIDGGYGALALRTGADIQFNNTNVNQLPANKVVWKDIPDGVWFDKIPYLWPVNSPDSWLLNIAKFKAHGMGITGCAKNLQGSIAASYQQHCTAFHSNMSINSSHIKPNAKNNIENNYNRHVVEGIPRWDRPGSDGGIWMETWASRCIDNNSVTKPALNIIEGIYGRDGNFVLGPHNGLAKDYMTNIIIFGKNSYYVDVIAHWLAGHEPGNFGLFHLARERGLINTFNPHDIPVYEWDSSGNAELKNLNTFERTDLQTYYLQRDYDGQTEAYWHMCNEAYDYSTSVEKINVQDPESFVLYNNYPNPFNPTTSIEFNLPRNGHARLEILNIRGEIVDVLMDGYMEQGDHLKQWNGASRASGTYFYRLVFDSYKITKQMTLIR